MTMYLKTFVDSARRNPAVMMRAQHAVLQRHPLVNTCCCKGGTASCACSQQYLSSIELTPSAARHRRADLACFRIADTQELPSQLQSSFSQLRQLDGEAERLQTQCAAAVEARLQQLVEVRRI